MKTDRILPFRQEGFYSSIAISFLLGLCLHHSNGVGICVGQGNWRSWWVTGVDAAEDHEMEPNVDKRPAAPHGFALWFTGAPYDARLAVTQFWHPALQTGQSSDHGDTVSAVAANGDISWGIRDRVPKALAHFAVCALSHLVQTKGIVLFGYSGVAQRTLFNAFRRATYRPRSIAEIFSKARRSVEVPQGTNMEETFLDVVGSEQRPLVRLQKRFHVRFGIDQTFPIYVFWDTSVLNRPDWSLSRITDPIGLDKLASVLERSLQEHVGSARRGESLATATAETPEQGNGVLAQAPAGLARGDEIGSSVSGSELEGNHGIANGQPAIAVARQIFIRHTLNCILGEQSHSFARIWAFDFVSDEVIATLPHFPSVDEVIESCEKLHAIDDSYRKALRSLSVKWSDLRPSVKAEILNYLENSQLKDDLGFLPPLTIVDREDLNVQWDAADLQYDRERQRAFEICRLNGCDLDEATIDARYVGEVVAMLSKLLEKKVEIDTSQLVSDGAKLSRGNRFEILNRLHRAHRDLSELFKNALVRQYTEFCASELKVPAKMVTRSQVSLMMKEVDRLCDPLNDTANRLELSLGLRPCS